MTEPEIRQLIVQALKAASLNAMVDQQRLARYLEGADDIPLREFDIDSLAAMELCIAIEVNCAVSIAPEELDRIGSLQQLATAIGSGGA